ncbi:FAD-binding oxidoreductase [Gordonia sp. DT30]|uniref:FAD-binding oxidoreductase n=1 Tax=Gordonia sp. DT30 TaxID=3416546 RepID=UPI003CFA1AC9
MQTPTARSLRLALSESFDAVAGAHVDIRLTAADGYSTARAYSLSDVREDRTVEVTVERLDDGEVSPYLVDVVEVGEPLEISGPHGRWFTWNPTDTGPVQLIGGGSGIVPLMSMIRMREIWAPATQFNLVYSIRAPQRRYFASELRQLVDHGRLPVNIFHTRIAPEDDPRPPARVSAAELASVTIPPEQQPLVYVCGPNGFVEHCAAAMLAAGHDSGRIRTERFG